MISISICVVIYYISIKERNTCWADVCCWNRARTAHSFIKGTASVKLLATWLLVRLSIAACPTDSRSAGPSAMGWNDAPTQIGRCGVIYREGLIYVVRDTRINIASFLKRLQRQDNTPLFLTRSEQPPPKQDKLLRSLSAWKIVYAREEKKGSGICWKKHLSHK